MENRKKSVIMLIALMLLIFISLYIIITKNNIQKLNSQDKNLESTEFIWDEEFGNTNTEFSTEDKQRVYKETVKLTLENAILDEIGQLNDVKVEIDSSNEMTSVSIKLDIDSGAIIDKKKIDDMYNLVLKSIEGLSEENIIVIDQEGNEIK